jgi:hypothetical protein
LPPEREYSIRRRDGLDRCVERIGKFPAQREEPPDQHELRRTRGPVAQAKIGFRRRLAQAIIDGPAIVGIDQAEIPQLASLVEIGHARGGIEALSRGTSVPTERCLQAFYPEPTDSPPWNRS